MPPLPTEPDPGPPPSSLEPLLVPEPAGPPDEYVASLKESADKLAADRAGRGDLKLVATAVKELRYCFKVFGRYRAARKVSVFGSARTAPGHPAYQAAVEFGRQIAAAGYMVITGAAQGIMEAGHVGAGRDMSFGLNIILPFEQTANPVIHGDPKLMNLRYFFTRKLLFLKESAAVVLFPGGFGTHDEAFEALTLIQTGKSHVFPVVLVDEPGGTYWRRWQEFVTEDLLKRGYIAPADMSLYRITDSVPDAVREVTDFYRVYHSMRYVRDELVLRLSRRVTDATLELLNREYADVLTTGRFVQTRARRQEKNEPELMHLPRLAFRADRAAAGRLRQVIDAVNADPGTGEGA